jgi:hypothetical protein
MAQCPIARSEGIPPLVAHIVKKRARRYEHGIKRLANFLPGKRRRCCGV